MLLPNFNNLDPSLIWQKPVQKDVQNSLLTLINEDIKHNPLFLIPPVITLLSIITLSFLNLLTQNSINSLSPSHDEFKALQAQLSSVNSKNSKLVSELRNTEMFLLNSIHIPVFARQLQLLVPTDVQLSEYNLTDAGIFISASSYNLQALNDFIVFFSTHPLVLEKSVSITELTSSSIATGSQPSQSTSMIKSPNIYNLKLSASYRNSDPSQLMDLLLKSSNYGLYTKLQQISVQEK